MCERLPLALGCAAGLVCMCAPADELQYWWDVNIVVTSIPQGSGRGVWRSPEPVDTSALHYWMTSHVTMAAALLPPFSGTWDSGEELSAADVAGPLAPLPCVLTDQTVVRTNLQRIFLIVITSVASTHARVQIGTDSFVYSEIANFYITNLTMGGYTGVELTVSGATNDGRGVLLVAAPEARAGLVCVLGGLFMRRRAAMRRPPASGALCKAGTASARD